MRGVIPILLALALLVAAPGVAADDDEVTIPETGSLEQAAEGYGDDQVDSTTAFTRNTWGNASEAANEAQDLEFPTDELVNLSAGAGVFGARSIQNGQAFVNAATTWAGDVVLKKTAETRTILSAADEVGQSAGDAVAEIVFAALRAVCSQPIDPTACEEGSIVDALQQEVDRILQEGSDDLAGEPFDGTQGAVLRLLAGIAPVPEV